MIISSISSMSLDLESQHEGDDRDQYSMSLNYRQTAHQLYGQTFDGIRHDLLIADTLEVKIETKAVPELSVTVEGKFQTLSVYLVKPEICGGLEQIIQALRKEAHFASHDRTHEKQSFLRRLPPFLQHVYLHGSDFYVEVAGVDAQTSRYSRGLSLQLDTWTTEYKAHREDVYLAPARRRSTSRASQKGERSPSKSSASPRKRLSAATDGRRLALHVEGLEGLIVDTLPKSEPKNFLSLPRMEVAFSTSTDQHGPIFHINCGAEKLYLFYLSLIHISEPTRPY